MKIKIGLGFVALGIVVLLPLTSWAQSGPFFGTFLPNGQPEDTFSPSESLLLKGGNWGANKLVGAAFDQNPTSELGTSVTDDQGDFTMLTSIPGGATNGPAVITVAVSFATGTVTRSRPVHITGSGVGEGEEPEEEDRDTGGLGQQQQQQQQVLNVAASESAKLPVTGTQTGLLGGTGSSLILLGLGLLVWANRRRRNPLRPAPAWSLLPLGAESASVSSRPRPSLPASFLQAEAGLSLYAGRLRRRAAKYATMATPTLDLLRPRTETSPAPAVDAWAEPEEERFEYRPTPELDEDGHAEDWTFFTPPSV